MTPAHSDHIRNGGDLVIETLEALGTRMVFGIPGQHALGMFDALRRSSLTFISSRVENNAVFSADGYSRETGLPGVLLLSTGPGALTSLAAVQEAYATCVPLIVIASQIPSSGLGGRRKGMLHQLDDQKESARNVTKTQSTALSTSAIPYVIEDAWNTAISAPQGPVWIEIPQDVLLAPATTPPPTEITGKSHTPQPHPASIEEAAKTLTAASRPAIICGGGVRRSHGAQEELVELAHLIDAPVICTPGGNSGFPSSDPLCAGNWIEDTTATTFLQEADALLAIGTSLGEVTSNYFTLSPGEKLIHIDAEWKVLESNYSALGIRADACAGLSALISAIERRKRDLPSERKNAHVTWQQAGGAERRALDVRKTIEGAMKPHNCGIEWAFLAGLRSATPPTMSTFWDMTIASYWAWNVWDAQDGAFHSAQGAGGLGFAFPAACGAAAGSGDRVLAVAGDGCAMYGIAELASAKQHNLPVTWIIIDDCGYGILRHYMISDFGAATATELARPNFVDLCESFGIRTRHVDVTAFIDIERFERTLQEELELDPHHGPGVIVVRTQLQMWSQTERQ